MSTNLHTQTFPVAGMSCASCAISVESTLKSTEGVISASVNFANQQAQIEYDSNKVTPPQLRKAVELSGYNLILDSKKSVQETSDDIQQALIQRLRIQTIFSLTLAVPVAIIGMFFMHIPYGNYIMLALTTPVVVIIGAHFYVKSWKQLLHLKANMDTLVAVSTGVAFSFSIFNTFYPDYIESKGLVPHVYYETTVIIIAFVSLGKWMEERAKSGTSIAIKKLIGLQAKTVRIISKEGIEKEIDIADIQVNDFVIVKSGEKIAVDGIVTEGESYIDESTITGEPIPAFKKRDSNIFAGTINQQGTLKYKAMKVGDETLIAHIIKMVQRAQGSKAPVQKLVDKIAGIFVPVVILIAIITFIIWQLVGGENAFFQGLLAAISVLVVACPCALGLATPTAIMVGIGKAAEHAILIKDAESLEQARNINALVVDKTGTITEGKPSVIEIIWKEQFNTIENNSILFQLENKSSHPLAYAITSHLTLQSILSLPISAYENIPGKGLYAFYKNQIFYIGNEILLKEQSIEISPSFKNTLSDWEKRAYTVVFFSNQTEVLAIIAIADKIKIYSIEAIKQLMDSGIEVYMLTGDTEITAKAVAEQIGIKNFKGSFLPNDKQQFILQLQSQGKKVAMVGDGINDSQALAQSDVSIAMGKGSDIAIDIAKITLLTSNLLSIPNAIRLSKDTVKIIRENLFWAFIYNIIGIPIAAGILYPIWDITLDPMLASAMMALSSVSVVSNSLRLNYWK